MLMSIYSIDLLTLVNRDSVISIQAVKNNKLATEHNEIIRILILILLLQVTTTE